MVIHVKDLLKEIKHFALVRVNLVVYVKTRTGSQACTCRGPLGTFKEHVAEARNNYLIILNR